MSAELYAVLSGTNWNTYQQHVASKIRTGLALRKLAEPLWTVPTMVTAMSIRTQWRQRSHGHRFEVGRTFDAPRYRPSVIISCICWKDGLPWRGERPWSRNVVLLFLPDENVGLISLGSGDERLRRLIADWSTTINTSLSTQSATWSDTVQSF